MYDELVKRLRDNAEFLVKASSGCLSNSFADTMYQAADAIEELQKRVPKRPHGRLIDADAMIRDIEKSLAPSWYIKERNADMVKFLSLEDTIIPAEEGDYS